MYQIRIRFVAAGEPDDDVALDPNAGNTSTGTPIYRPLVLKRTSPGASRPIPGCSSRPCSSAPFPTRSRFRCALSFSRFLRAKLKDGFVINLVRTTHPLQSHAYTQSTELDDKRASPNHSGRFPHHACVAEYPRHEFAPFTSRSLIQS